MRPVTPVGTGGLRQHPVEGSHRLASTRTITTTGNTEQLLSQGYELLRERQWDPAVKVFQAIKPETRKQHENKINGLARALYPQPGKAKTALDLLNQLPVSVQTATLLTKSRVLQALHRHEEAEALLKQADC
ncbi:hypothetical protein [Endozoicomonas sp. SCSIO W0465]|uniref:hypothetical protein n=1 Tax=Endozoicomonas sp. SCSIO W0465 TaxID=2918516 RepID=UPI0020760FF6|nr:hypothetical protein [Endozoicomonas sp. SCSIO W0465]USE37844.1 hypothetical protein MJO57_06525 [Endozoicomonas sp. SCSIO W0465]